MISVPQAISFIQKNQPHIMMTADRPPVGEVLKAYDAIEQPARVNVQALAALGEQLEQIILGARMDVYLTKLNDAPFENRFAIIARALLSNVFLDLPPQIAEVFVQEASEALESGSARLVSTKEVKAARRVHVVTQDGSKVFLRAVEYGGGASELEIQSNFTGPAIQRDPIGTLSRATMIQCRWEALPGWWVVQPPGGYRAETSEMARLRRLLAPAPEVNEKPKAQENKPESSVPTPQSR